MPKEEQIVRLPMSCLARRHHRWVWAAITLMASLPAAAQQAFPSAEAQRARAGAFLAQRRSPRITPQAASMFQPRAGSLAAAWQPLGPASIISASYGRVTGRVTAIAADFTDSSGNTVYVGTTGGGVWKSTNAAAALASVTFTPLTDTLPVFTSGSALPSLSIGALALQAGSQGVLLAGTGDPNDATDSYYGEGILRSADGGLTWTLAQDSHDGANGNHSFIGLSVGALAWSSASPSLVVAALSTSAEGDAVGAINASSIPGLYYSTDAGLTWQMASIYDGASIVQQPQPLGTGEVGNAVTAVAWNPVRQRFYAAVRQHGFYESSDGVTWTRLLNQPGTGLTTVNCPVGVNGLGKFTCPIFRGALAVQPVTGDMYALSVDSTNNDNGIWQDLCGATASTCSTSAPTFAHRIDAGALEVGSGNTTIPQGDYNLTFGAAITANGTVLFAGTVDLYRCSMAAGASICTLRNTTNALNGCNAPAQVAPAQHAIAFGPTTPLMFVGNDGGLWRSPDGVAETGSPCSAGDAQHFDNLNGSIGSLAEVTGFAEHPTDPDTLLAGLGANGSAATTSASAQFASGLPWPQMAAGEGGYPLLDPAQTAIWYIATGAGISLKQCTLGGACTAASFAGTPTVGPMQVANEPTLLDAPTLLDPAVSSNVLVGTCRVWRGPGSGGIWTAANAISKPFAGGTSCTTSSLLVRSLAAGGPKVSSANLQNAGSTVLYAGLASGGSLGGHVFVTTAGASASSTTAWTDAALNPVTNDVGNAHQFNPFGFDISSVMVDAHDTTGATVYVTVMGFGTLLASSPHIYSSTDFGAHWLALSANLPDAPANALAIDPNDANTVYVALDTGVYVTTQIATCPTSNCWSVFGTALPNSPVVALAIAPGMLTGDGRKGMLRAATYGRGLWQTPLLSATSLAQPAITLAPTSLTFGPQQVGTQSAPQTVTITSNGNAPVTISSITLTGDFAQTGSCVGQTLAVGATCIVQVLFAPAATGTRNGLLTVFANVSGGQATVSLTGTGTTPAAVVLTPPSLTFAATIVNQTSASQIITVANTGGTASPLSTPAVTGDFQVAANTCGSALPPSTSCSLSVTFTPAASGVRNGTLSVTDDAGTQTATLTGTGNSPATDALSPLSLTFAPQQIGTASAAQQVLLTNSGDVPLTLINAVVSSGPFTVMNACGNSLAPHSTCAINVAFVPTATGAASGVLSVTDQFRVQTVSLAGIGLAPAGVSLTPSAGLAFGAIGVGLTSATQALVLTNNGGVTLSIASTTVSGDFHLASNTCAATLAPGAACTISIVFTPTIGGTRQGALTLVDNAAGGTQSAALTGTGIDYTLTANGPTSITVASGTSAVYTLALAATAGVNGTAAMACTGAPAHSLCTVTPSPAALGGSVNITVTVQTGLATAYVVRPLFGRAVEVIALALLLPLGCLARRRQLRPLLTALAAVSLLSLSGCGAGRQIPAGGLGTPTPTPSGTYNLNVSAASAGLTRSVGLTLVVQ